IRDPCREQRQERRHEARRRRQHRRSAPHGEAPPAQDRLRFHRGRVGGRARAGDQHRGLPQASPVAALPRRRVEARPVEDDLRPDLFQPVRHLADLMLAEAARDANIPYIMSGASNDTIEAAAKIAPKNHWYQLYAARDYAINADMIKRAADNGLGAVVLTVDTPVGSKRERNIRNGFAN